MKVAFATQDQQRVDAHFGWAKHLAVYDVTPTGYTFLQDFGFGEDLAEDGDEDKLAPKLAAIADCAIVYVAAIGGSAAARDVQVLSRPLGGVGAACTALQSLQPPRRRSALPAIASANRTSHAGPPARRAMAARCRASFRRNAAGSKAQAA